MSDLAIQSQPAQLHELGRYSLSDQERVLVGRPAPTTKAAISE
jgi:hypothetical protein